MKKKVCCDFGDVIYDINTYNEKDYKDQLNHIKKFYVPSKLPQKDVKEIEIDYITEEYLFKKYLDECRKREGKFFQSFDNQIHKEIELGSNKKVYLINTEEYIGIKDDEKKYIILTDGRDEGIRWPFRIVRELLVREREDRKKLFMHGTGIDIDNNGILFLVNSGSGKTTMAVDILLKDFDFKGFISNDRVFLGNSIIDYFPIPVVIAAGTAKGNIRLNEYLVKNNLYEGFLNKKFEDAKNNDKVPIPLLDIKEIFDKTDMLPSTKLNVVAFPRINLNMNSNFVIRELNRKEKYIAMDRTCFTPFDSESLRLEWIKKRKRSIDEIVENKYDVINDTIDKVNMIEIEYGVNSDKEKIIKELLK